MGIFGGVSAPLDLPAERKGLGRFLAAPSVGRLLTAGALLILTASGQSQILQMARSTLLLLVLAHIGSGVVSCLAPDARGSWRAAATFVMAVAFAWVLAIVLGALGWLRYPVFAVVSAVACTLLSWCWPGPRRESRGGPNVEHPAWVAAALTVACVAAMVASDARENRFLPPGAGLYDDVSYHLPAAALWSQTGDLRMLRFAYGDRSTCFYPFGGELASWILLSPFDGSDFLARWSQLPAALGILLLTWAMARRAGASGWGALVAAVATCAVPRLFPGLALSAGNDLWAALLCLAALLLIPAEGASMRLGSWLLLGTALGALALTKYVTLLWLPWLGLAALPAVAQVLGSSDRRRGGWWILVGGGLALCVGGFPYVRNWVSTGNPVFPQPVSLLGWKLFPGWQATSLGARRAVDAVPWFDLGAFVREPALLGPLWSRALIPLAVLLPLATLAWLRKVGFPRSEAIWRLSLAAGPAWLLVVYATALHDHRDIRYAIAAVPLAAACAAGLASSLAPKLRMVLGALVVAVALAVVWGARPQAHTVAVVFAVASLALTYFVWRRPVAGYVLAQIALVGTALVASRVLPDYEGHRERFEPAALALEKLTQGRPTVVAYIGGNRPYFYFGNRLQNRVEIVPTRGDPAERHYRWGSDVVADPYEGGSGQGWYRRLGELDVEFVVVDGPGLNSLASSWLYRSRSPLEPVASGKDWSILTWRATS